MNSCSDHWRVWQCCRPTRCHNATASLSPVTLARTDRNSAANILRWPEPSTLWWSPCTVSGFSLSSMASRPQAFPPTSRTSALSARPVPSDRLREIRLAKEWRRGPSVLWAQQRWFCHYVHGHYLMRWNRAKEYNRVIYHIRCTVFRGRGERQNQRTKEPEVTRFEMETLQKYTYIYGGQAMLLHFYDFSGE